MKQKQIIMLCLTGLVALSACIGDTVIYNPVKSQETSANGIEQPISSNKNGLVKTDTYYKRSEKVAGNISEALYDLGKNVILDNTSDDNILISPLSIERCFAMAIEGADGDTKDEIVGTIYEGLDFKAESTALTERCDELSEYEVRTNSDSGIETSSAFQTANSVWINTDYGISMKQDYIDTLNVKYGASADNASFSGDAAHKINSWVKDNTDGQIDNIINKLEPDDQMVLVNATLFEGAWEDKFTLSKEDIVFRNKDGSENDPVYLQSDNDRYIEVAGCDGFIKDYQNGFYYMGILPREGEAAEDLLKRITWNDIREGAEYTGSYDLIVSFPKYHFDYSLSLNNSLTHMGIKKAFTDDADFSRMSDTQLKISDAIQKTHIEVDENGTKAAAATVIIMIDKTAMLEQNPVKTLTFDRPFLFFIMSGNDNIPAFMGIVNSTSVK